MALTSPVVAVYLQNQAGVVRDPRLPLPVRISARRDARSQARRREAVIEAEAVPARAALQHRVPRPFRRAGIVVHVHPAAGR